MKLQFGYTVFPEKPDKRFSTLQKQGVNTAKYYLNRSDELQQAKEKTPEMIIGIIPNKDGSSFELQISSQEPDTILISEARLKDLSDPAYRKGMARWLLTEALPTLKEDGIAQDMNEFIQQQK